LGHVILSSADIGFCSIVMAELWAIKIGVQIAWSRGFQQFQVESDSQVAIT